MTLDARMRNGMTAEWTMQERYADSDPSFCPGQPNASANGRLLMMLMDIYGEAEAERDTPRPGSSRHQGAVR